VIEADEYDTAFFDKRSKFLHYLPEVVVMNNIEFDHADIYASIDEIKLSFRRLLNIVPRSGMAFINGDDPNCLDVAVGAIAPVRTVGIGGGCDLVISGIDYTPEGSGFSLDGERYSVPMVGEFNVRNAAMAVCTARFIGLTPAEIRAGLASFEGVARRQELRGEANGVKVIDDFAHHPTAIAQAVRGLRQRYPGSRLWVLFEARSNTTRRNVFQHELAAALAEADFAVIPNVPDADKVALSDRLDPQRLVEEIGELGGKGWYLPGVEEIVSLVGAEARPGDVVAVLSNGGFGGIHQRLLDRLAAG
jgi:UDP-N-acetylmuramate: L-alanyl-gamma-D-glutamyl-meso-diaminopimelate ligase